MEFCTVVVDQVIWNIHVSASVHFVIKFVNALSLEAKLAGDGVI